MGLKERRGVKAFEEKSYPEIKKQIDTAAGFPVEVEVFWESLETDGYAHMFEEAFPKVFFKPVIEAIKEICVDDMGRDALKEKLKRVVIRDSGSKTLGFKDGILTVDHGAVTNVDYWLERKTTLQNSLEAAL